MSSYTLSEDELLAHLRDQIYFMIDSAISYDNGFEGEAKRLAATIRILVHDTGSCSALLTQLKKMSILFYDSSSFFDPNNPLTSSCLILKGFTNDGSGELKSNYVAPLDSLPPTRDKDKLVSFDRWWHRTVIFRDKSRNLFARRDIVLPFADKEGGAHIDPKLNQAYANLTKFNSLAWKVYTAGEERDFGNPVPPTVRQIAHEIIKTIRDGVIDLFTDRSTLLNKFEEYENHCQERNKRLHLE